MACSDHGVSEGASGRGVARRLAALASRVCSSEPPPPSIEACCGPLPRAAALRRRVRVAVVGAGVGGSALACWLREAFGEDLDLAVFGDGPVGGRCRAVDFEGERYEAGAAIVSELNWHFVSFMKRYGMTQRCVKDHVYAPMGLFDGSKFTLRSPDPSAMCLPSLAGAREAIRFLGRYGLAGLRRLKSLASGPDAPDFPRFYALQSTGAAFETPVELLEALQPGLSRLARTSAEAWLVRERGIPERLVHELATGGMRSNYGGQSCAELHALVGFVSIAGGLSSRCFGVGGGNEGVPRRALEAASARLLGPARAVQRGQGGLRVVRDGDGGEVGEDFDVVVLAHPLERSALRFEGGLRAPARASGDGRLGCFRRCVAHFVRGAPRREAFGVSSGALPIEILTGADSSAPFYSIGLQFPVTATADDIRRIVRAAQRGEPQVYKVFASRVLSREELGAYFTAPAPGPLPCEVVGWFAYPEYEVPQELLPFVLDDGLLYLNAIEQAASAMEMSLISARNAVSLIQRWVDQRRGTEGF